MSPFHQRELLFEKHMTKQIFNLTVGEKPVFAWRLPAEIASYKQARLPAGQWINVIKGFSQKGIKLAEIADSKVSEWLQEKGNDQVTREELAEYTSFALPAIKELRLSGQDTKYRHYSWANDAQMDYNESMFYFPTIAEDFADRIAELDEAISVLNFDFEKLGEDPDLPIRLDIKRSELLIKQATASQKQGGPRTHFAASLQEICPDARADFAHLRWSVATFGEKRVLFLHEMQSDWAQKGRANQWSGDYKQAPLVTETEHWTAFLLRRGMALAVEYNCSDLAWINGREMVNGGHDQSAFGPDEFYQKIVPGVAKKLAKPFASELYLDSISLRERERKLAFMPITPSMRERFVPKAAVYSYAKVVENASFDPKMAAKLQRALQLRADKALGESAMHVSVVREIFGAAKDNRAVGELVGNVAKVAFSAQDPMQALDHEAFHFAYRYKFTSRERQQVARHFSPGTPLLIRTIRLLMSNGENEAALQAARDPEEAAAHGFSLWRKGHMTLEKVLATASTSEARVGISNVVARLFPAAEKFVRSVVGWIRQVGTSPADFMAKVVRAYTSGDRESALLEDRMNELFGIGEHEDDSNMGAVPDASPHAR